MSEPISHETPVPSLLRDFYPHFLELATRYRVIAGQDHDYTTFEGFLRFLAKPLRWYRRRHRKISLAWTDKPFVDYRDYVKFAASIRPIHDVIVDSRKLLAFARKRDRAELKAVGLDHVILQLLHCIQNYSTRLHRLKYDQYCQWYRRCKLTCTSDEEWDLYYPNPPPREPSCFEETGEPLPVEQFIAYLQPPPSLNIMTSQELIDSFKPLYTRLDEEYEFCDHCDFSYPGDLGKPGLIKGHRAESSDPHDSYPGVLEDTFLADATDLVAFAMEWSPTLLVETGVGPLIRELLVIVDECTSTSIDYIADAMSYRYRDLDYSPTRSEGSYYDDAYEDAEAFFNYDEGSYLRAFDAYMGELSEDDRSE